MSARSSASASRRSPAARSPTSTGWARRISWRSRSGSREKHGAALPPEPRCSATWRRRARRSTAAARQRRRNRRPEPFRAGAYISRPARSWRGLRGSRDVSVLLANARRVWRRRPLRRDRQRTSRADAVARRHWLQKVRAGSELLADGAKDKSGRAGRCRSCSGLFATGDAARRASPCASCRNSEIDGSFKGETADAVRAFQAGSFDANGAPLVSDAIVGKATLAALDRLVLPLPDRRRPK